MTGEEREKKFVSAIHDLTKQASFSEVLIQLYEETTIPNIPLHTDIQVKEHTELVGARGVVERLLDAVRKTQPELIIKILERVEYNGRRNTDQ